MDNKPLVSIICITYNHAAYIRDCIDGFLMQQADFQFEIIIHDDASTDGTADIIRAYAELHPDIIRPIIQLENQYSKHHNFSRIIMPLLDISKGDFIAFCEGDDYWIDPCKLKKQIYLLQTAHDLGLCYTDVNVLNQSKNRTLKNYLSNHHRFKIKKFEDQLIEATFLAPCTWVIRREVFKLPSETYTDLTYPLLLNILANNKICFLRESTAVYRQLSESASKSKDKNKLLNFYLGILKITKDYIAKYPQLISPTSEITALRARYTRILPFAIQLNRMEIIDEIKRFDQEYGLKKIYSVLLCHPDVYKFLLWIKSIIK